MAETKKFFFDFIEKLKKDKKSLLTVLIGLFGILLILLSELPLFYADDGVKSENEVEYVNRELESEVEKLLSQVDGAGKVSVMLSYESDVERVYATDKDIRMQDGNEEQNSTKYITVDSSDGETGLVVKTIYPKIRGVAVVCSGGGNPEVVSEIKALVSALFDIGSNRISIARRAEGE